MDVLIPANIHSQAPTHFSVRFTFSTCKHLIDKLRKDVHRDLTVYMTLGSLVCGCHHGLIKAA